MQLVTIQLLKMIMVTQNPEVVTRRQTRSLTRSASKNAKTKSKGRRGRKKNVDSSVDNTKQLDEIVPEIANQSEDAVNKSEVPLNVSVTDEDVDLFFESLAEGPPTKVQKTATDQGHSEESLSDNQRRRTRSQKTSSV